MAFQLQTRERDGIPIVAPVGRLNLGEAVEKFRTEVERLREAGNRHIVLDLSGTEYIDSSGLGCLVVSHTRAQKVGGTMPIFGLSQRSIDLLVLTKLVTIFATFDNETDAVNSCFPDRQAKRFDILNFVQDQGKKA